VGFLGWMSRRALAVWIFAPLVAFWCGVFAFGLKVPPGTLGLAGRPQDELLVAATAAALVSDWLIMRRVKRAMKARQERAERG